MHIIAHRGASWDAPENTLAAIRLAWEQGVDGVEVDAHLSNDGRVVVIHDDNTKRTAGLDKLVADQSWEEIRRLDAGAWKGSRWAGEPIPLFEEVLATIPAGKRLIVEVKCGVKIVPALRKAIDDWGGSPDQVVLMSFSFEVCRALREGFPLHAVWWLIECPEGASGREAHLNSDEVLGAACEAKLDGLGLHCSEPLSGLYVRKLAQSGLCVYAWTVDDLEVAQRMKDCGVVAMASNKPAFIMQEMDKV